eukprot:6047932-Amphidinium_carterae.1
MEKLGETIEQWEREVRDYGKMYKKALDEEIKIGVLAYLARRKCGGERGKESQRVSMDGSMSLHARLGCRLPHQHPLHYWIPDFAATRLNRYSVGDDGKTAEQLRTGRGWHRPAISFGETVLVKKLQVTVAKKDLELRFVRGRFLGHMSRSATALVMTAQGFLRGTGLSRRAERTLGLARNGTCRQNATTSAPSPTHSTSTPLRNPAAGRAFYITRADVGRHNATQGCTACLQILCGERQTNPHTRECRERLEAALLAEGDGVVSDLPFVVSDLPIVLYDLPWVGGE